MHLFTIVLHAFVHYLVLGKILLVFLLDTRIYDELFYVNTLSGHIAFFYSSFSGFLTSLLQIIIYSSYLLIVDSRSVGLFIVGVAILVYPIKKLLIGIIFFPFLPSIIILASSAINSGRESPIGEAVAIFPAMVHTFLIWTEPYLFKIL